MDRSVERHLGALVRAVEHLHRPAGQPRAVQFFFGELRESGVVPVQDRQDGRPRPADGHGVGPQFVGGVKNRFRARYHRKTVGLMQPVLNRHPQVLQAPRKQGGRHQRGAGKIVNRVLSRHFRRQRRPGHFRFELKIRDENREPDRMRHRHADGVDPAAVHHGRDQSPEQGGRHVVGVSFQFGGEIRHIIGSGIGGDSFDQIANSLKNNDPYMVLRDFDSYDQQRKNLMRTYRTDPDRWQRMSLVNIAQSGYFCADRAIHEYARDIWHLD